MPQLIQLSPQEAYVILNKGTEPPFTGEYDDFFVEGTATLVSGPGGPDGDADDAFTTYSYGAGTISLALSGFDDNGNPLDGTFVASTLPFSFTVCEGCDSLFGGGTANDFAIALGPGKFSGGLAALFHVGARTQGGFIDFGLEAIDGDPDSVTVNGTAGSVTAANAQTDAFAVTAATPATSELVVQIVGVVP